MSDSPYLYLSWEKLHRSCFLLSQKIQQSQIKFDRILAISRGGLVVARILSDFLGLSISVFTIVGYDGLNKLKKSKVIEGLKADISNETVLLVDEVADTGETYLVALKYLDQFSPHRVYSSAPYIKPQTKYTPDFWQTKTDKWIIFPYEVTETARVISRDELTRNKLEKILKFQKNS